MEKQITDCKTCGGNAIIKYKTRNLLDGEIILKHELYYKCTKCNREFVTSEQMYEAERRLKECRN